MHVHVNYNLYTVKSTPHYARAI